MKNYNEVLEYASAVDESLTQDKFINQVNWSHVDGSRGCWQRAFAKLYGEWWIIYTEHHSYFVYHNTDLIQLEEVDLKNKTVTVLVKKEK